MDDLIHFDPFAPRDDGGQAGEEPPQLHRIQEVRLQQEVSLRAAARQLGMHVPRVKMQEQPSADLRISDLHRWQQVLEVPLAELLTEVQDCLSDNVRERARMIRLMKTVHAIVERARTAEIQALARQLVDQLVAVMPELKDVSPWHEIGQRRSTKDLGRIAERQISERFLGGLDE